MRFCCQLYKAHQPLDYKTPLQFFKDNGIIQKDTPLVLSHIE